jgi:hypothetical protein
MPAASAIQISRPRVSRARSGREPRCRGARRPRDDDAPLDLGPGAAPRRRREGGERALERLRLGLEEVAPTREEVASRRVDGEGKLLVEHPWALGHVHPIALDQRRHLAEREIAW